MNAIKAEVFADNQHGPGVAVTIDGTRVSVYLGDGTGVVTAPDGQYGLEVTGPWYRVNEQLKSISETGTASDRQFPKGEN